MLEMANDREMQMIHNEQIDDLRDLINHSSRLVERKRSELLRGEGDPAVLQVQIQRAEENIARALKVAERDGVLSLVAPDVAAPPPPPPPPLAAEYLPPVSVVAKATDSSSSVRTSPAHPPTASTSQAPPVNVAYRPTPVPVPSPSQIHRPVYQPSTTVAAPAAPTHSMTTTGVFSRDMAYGPGLGVAMSDMANREIQTHGVRLCTHEPGALYTLNRVLWVAIGVGLEAGAGLLSRMIQAGHTPFDLDAPFRGAYRKLFKPME